jgi:class 3 adenylate cyclase
VNRILAGKAALEGERKIITILFADIKGSMDIMEGLDPEESKQLFDPCLHHMIEAVHRAEGTVSRVLGDGILALFGAPLAIEDHPHRALYAALLMHETVGRYAAELYQRHAITLQIRVGINTGEVVVGTIGTNLFMEYTPVGHAVGLAARMEALASPGSTLVTASTFHLTQEYFRFTPRGAIHIKGVKEPLDVYELAGSKGRQSRLAARSAHGLTPFLGRTQELAYMQELATQAISGHGQIISVIGEAGMGKSRLLEELKPTLRAQGFLLIEGAGFAYGKTRAYLPLIDMLKCYCSINDQDSPAVYREKLHETLAAVHPSLTSYVPLFLDLLEVGSTIPEVASLSAEAKLQKVLAGIKSLIALQSHRQPLALVVEDLHWLDARSLAFLQALTAGLAQIPVLLLLSYRPGESYPWETFPFSHRLQLAPLSRPELTSLFTTLGGADPAVAALAPEVCERSGGNPFFLEELVQSLRETGVLGGQVGAHKLAQPLAATTLPATVQGVLASRLDRLAPGHKSLLQTAAVIGRAVPRSLLLYVTGTPEEELDQVLHLLQTREFLYEAAIYPERVYSFKHALTQEVAYQELLHERRSYLHAAVGNAIETLYAEKLPEYVTLLAYHYSRSSETRKALHYLSLAGLRAFNL